MDPFLQEIASGIRNAWKNVAFCSFTLYLKTEVECIIILSIYQNGERFNLKTMMCPNFGIFGEDGLHGKHRLNLGSRNFLILFGDLTLILFGDLTDCGYMVGSDRLMID